MKLETFMTVFAATNYVCVLHAFIFLLLYHFKSIHNNRAFVTFNLSTNDPLKNLA